MIEEGVEMGHIIRYCIECKTYMENDNCRNECRGEKYQNRDYSYTFKRTITDFGFPAIFLILAIVSLILTWWIPAIILGMIAIPVIIIILKEDLNWSYWFDEKTFEFKMGNKIMEGRWEDNPAIFYFPNPVRPEKLIMVPRTPYEIIEEGRLKDEVVTIDEEYVISDTSDIKNERRLRMNEIRNFIIQQFHSKGCDYVLLNTKIKRNPSYTLKRMRFNENEEEMAVEYIRQSLHEQSNTTVNFENKYWSTLGKCHSGWEISFNNFKNKCIVRKLKITKYGEDKTYDTSIDKLKNGNIWKKRNNEKIYCFNFNEGIVELKYNEVDDRDLTDYLLQYLSRESDSDKKPNR